MNKDNKKAWSSSLNNQQNIVNALSDYNDKQLEIANNILVNEIKNSTVNQKIKKRKKSFDISKKHAEVLRHFKLFIAAMLNANFSVAMICERLNHQGGIKVPTRRIKDEHGNIKNEYKDIVINVPYSQLLRWIKKEPDLCGLMKQRKPTK